MKKLIIAAVLFCSLTANAQTETKTRCKGITAKGEQCKRTVTNAVYCFQHERSHNNDTPAAAAEAKKQCAGITQKGTRCSRNAAKNSLYCFQHSNN